MFCYGLLYHLAEATEHFQKYSLVLHFHILPATKSGDLDLYVAGRFWVYKLFVKHSCLWMPGADIWGALLHNDKRKQVTITAIPYLFYLLHTPKS